MTATTSVPVSADLSQCRPLGGSPTAEWRADQQCWVFRLSLEDPSQKGENGLPAVLPLFVHVRKIGKRFEADIESDQTNYSQEGMAWKIKRAFLKGLRFWK